MLLTEEHLDYLYLKNICLSLSSDQRSCSGRRSMMTTRMKTPIQCITPQSSTMTRTKVFVLLYINRGHLSWSVDSNGLKAVLGLRLIVEGASSSLPAFNLTSHCVPFCRSPHPHMTSPHSGGTQDRSMIYNDTPFVGSQTLDSLSLC